MRKIVNNISDIYYGEHRVVEALIIALFIIAAVFPDVLFNGASLRLTDQITGAVRGVQLKPFYPIPMSTGWWGGYNDNGGATFQAEPMIEFMRNSIKSGDSPYWNPYSAAGSLGPEALVDQKFSAFTLINAVLGGGSLIYNATMLLLFYFAVFFTYRTARECLGLSVLAGIGASLFYLLNGYSAANFGSNVTQSYLYVPMCLYASLNFVERGSTARFVAIVFSFSVFLSCTFLPTTITSFIAIYAIIIGFVLAKIGRGELSGHLGSMLIALQSLAVVFSVLLLAVLYFPIFENIKSTGTLEDYSHRIFWALYFPQAIASLFSPSHFYESYNAMEATAKNWHGGSAPITGNAVFHMGVIAIALGGCSWSVHKHKYNRLIIVSSLCLLLVTCRLFEVPLLGGFISYLPIVGNIGCQYWWPAIMFPMVIVLGFGIDNLQRHNAKILPAIVLLFIGVATTCAVYKLYGFHEPHIEFKLASLLLLSVLTTILIALLLTLRFNRNFPMAGLIVLIIVIAMFVELMVDGKMLRFKRNDLFSTPPEDLTFVLKNIGLYRTLNFGQSGIYPELGSALQVQEITSMNQGVLPSYQDYFYTAIDLENSQRLGYYVSTPRGAFPTLLLIQDKPLTNKFNWPALDLLGVKYVLLPINYSAYKAELVQQGLRLVYETPATLVFENPNVLPRAFSVDLPVGKVDSDLMLPPDFRGHIHAATITSYKNTALEMKGTASAKMLVVISDNWHKNWSATLNGKMVPIVKVNGTFRGIAVEKGDYVIKMEYQPRTLSLAIAVSVGLLLLMFTILLNRKRLDNLIREKWLV